jgi:hypothetical protein
MIAPFKTPRHPRIIRLDSPPSGCTEGRWVQSAASPAAQRPTSGLSGFVIGKMRRQLLDDKFLEYVCGAGCANSDQRILER